MKALVATSLLAFSTLTSASNHVTVLLAGPNGVANIDVPTDNRAFNVNQRIQGDVERATLTFVSRGLEKARCRAFLDKQGTQLIGGKIEKDKDTQLGGEIKSLRCSPTLVLDGSFQVQRWVGGKADGHETADPNLAPPANGPPPPPVQGDAGKTVTINIGNQRTAGFKRIPLDNTPYVLPDNPPNFNPIEKARMVDDAGVAGAQCQAYTDEAATVPIGDKVSSSKSQTYTNDQTIMSFRCNMKSVASQSGSPPPSSSSGSTPPGAGQMFTIDPTKSASVRIGNSNTGSVKTIKLDNEVFVLADNPPSVGDIVDVVMNSDGGAKGATCNTYSDKAGVMSLRKPVSVDKAQKFTPPGEKVVSLRCHIVGSPGSAPPASPASPPGAAQTFTVDPSKSASVQIGNSDTGSVKTIKLDNEVFVLANNPPLVGDIQDVTMNSDGGASGATCNTYSDEAGVVSLKKPVSVGKAQKFTPPGEKVVSLRCHIVGTSTNSPPPSNQQPNPTSGSNPAAQTFTTDPSKRVAVQIGNFNTGSVKNIPLDNQVFVLSPNPPVIDGITSANMNNNSGVDAAECNTYSDEAGVVSLHKPININQSQSFQSPGEKLVSLRCHIKNSGSGSPGGGSAPTQSASAQTVQGTPGTDPSKSVSVNIGNQQTASTKSIPLDNQPFVLSQNPPAVGEVAFATMVNDAGVANARCQPYSDDAAKVSIGAPVTVRSSTMFNAANGEVVRSFRCNIAPPSRKRAAVFGGLNFRA